MGYGGVLRYGNDMKLSSLKVKSLDSAYYQLPSGTQQAQIPQSSSGSNDMGLGNDAKEIGADAKETTKDEIKEEVRGFIKGLFD